MTEPEREIGLSLRRHLAARLHPAALAIGLLISVGFPTLFYALEYNALRTTAQVYGRQLAKHFEGLILDAGEDLWKYSAHKYSWILREFLFGREVLSIRIEDEAGRPVIGYEYTAEGAGALWDRYAPVESVPIRFNNRILGNIHLQISQARIAGLTLVVLLASTAIGMSLAAFVYLFPVAIARRLEERIWELDRTTGRLAQMKKLAELSHLVGTSLELQHVLDFVAEAARDLLKGDLAGVWILDEARGMLKLAAMKGSADDAAADAPGFLLPQSRLVRSVIEGKARHYSPDVLEEPLEVDKERVSREGHVSEAAVPLIVGERALGALVVLRRAPRRFTEDERRVLEIFAANAATAVENARLYAAARRTLAELEAKNAELDSFTYSVSHDLTAPLVSVEGLVGSLVEDFGEQLDGRGRHYLDRIQVNVRQMEQLIQDLLALSRVGRESRAPEAVNLMEVVDDLVGEMAGPIQERGIKVTVREAATIWGIRTQVEQVVGNLLGNAIKYMGETGSPMVEVGAIDRGELVDCYVKDNGIGIDPAYHEKVFELFQRLNEVKAKGTGVGLAIVKRIVEGAGGRVWVESAKGQGATFRFTWPAVPSPGRHGSE
jgi:signal transduction histidine kinase